MQMFNFKFNTKKWKFLFCFTSENESVSHSSVSDSTTPWTVACQAPLSMQFSRQEYWSGLPFPSPSDLLDPGIKPRSPHCKQILYNLSHQGSPKLWFFLKKDNTWAVRRARKQGHSKYCFCQGNTLLWGQICQYIIWLRNTCAINLFCVHNWMSVLEAIFFSIFISWRLITLQYCSGFCHTFVWISHGFTCVPHPNPPSHFPLYPIPLGLPSAPGPSTCLMHPTWAGDLFRHR